MSPISSQPSASEINVELGRAANAPFDINGSAERGLAQVPSGPISFSDFIGKSSQTPYQIYQNFIAGIVTGQDLIGTSQIASATQNAWHRVTGLSETGSMYGGPFTGSSWTTQDSVYNRIIQHQVESYAEFQAIVANNWECCILRGGLASVSGYLGYTRNNYTSVSYAPAYPGCANLQLYWWDGTNAWYRYNGNARQPAY
jgi:hypothetical protein